LIQEEEFVEGFCSKLPYDRPTFEETIMAFLEVADAVNGEEAVKEDEDPLEAGFEAYCKQFDSPLFDAASSPVGPLGRSNMSVASEVKELSPAQRIRADRSARVEDMLSAAKEEASKSRRGYTRTAGSPRGAAAQGTPHAQLSPNAARLARQERLRGVIHHPAANAKMGKDFEEYLREGQRLALSPNSATTVTSRLVSRLDTYMAMGATMA